MAEQQPQPPRVPLGDFIDWSDADLDALSAVTDQDIEHAAQFWRDEAPPSMRTLLDATEEHPLDA